jgi:hypothetical protein
MYQQGNVAVPAVALAVRCREATPAAAVPDPKQIPKVNASTPPTR